MTRPSGAIEIGDPVSAPPRAQSRKRSFLDPVFERVKELAQGEWLPVTSVNEGQATSIVNACKKRGFNALRRGVVVYVEAHTHHFVYPPDASGDAIDGLCACGEYKRGVVSFAAARREARS